MTHWLRNEGGPPIGDYPPMPSLRKYVFIQDDPFYLPKVLDKYLREYHDSTVGVNIQPVVMGKRTAFQTAWELYRLYGFHYFQWKLRRFVCARLKAKLINGLLGSTSKFYSIGAVAKKYGVPVHITDDVNGEPFRALLRELKADLIVSISGTQWYGKKLREQMPAGIVNCHGALLPKYRGLMPSFWTLANNEHEGGVSVHYIDGGLDSGPIVVQGRYRINPQDTLEDIMARSKDMAAELIIESVRRIEAGSPELLPNPADQASQFSVPTREDVERFRATGHRFF
ncbi:MAG: hypothetical protein JW888_01695 [Pirellulales bacterium]|nr:hypothetical protein [Pirellulales bacterium]